MAVTGAGRIGSRDVCRGVAAVVTTARELLGR